MEHEDGDNRREKKPLATNVSATIMVDEEEEEVDGDEKDDDVKGEEKDEDKNGA